MDSARPSNPSNLLSLQKAALKLGVSVDVLLSWNEQHILKPTITSTGEIGYEPRQIENFLTAQQALQRGNSEKAAISSDTAGRAESKMLSSQNSPETSLYQKILHKLGGDFYSDSFSQEYARSKNNHTSSKPSYPSKKWLSVASVVFVLLGLVGFTQQGRLSYMVSQYQAQIERQSGDSHQSGVLAAQTSKLQLAGRIIFALPFESKNDVTLDKNLLVQGTSVFKGNITAPNVIYGVKAGNGITISNAASQTPTISVTGIVNSFQGQTGDVQLTPGTDIAIDGTTISDVSTLATVVARGTCSGCLKDDAVANTLTIDAGGNIAGEAIKTGIISPTVGGTGLTTYATGDLLYANTSSLLASLPIGTTNGQILQVLNGLPSWTSISLTGSGTNSTNSGANLVGVFPNLINSTSTNLQTVLQNLDSAISAAGSSPFSLAVDGTLGRYIFSTTSTDHFVLGGNGTIAASTLFFNAATANLSLGTPASISGILTLDASGVGATAPTIAASSSGDLLIPTGSVGVHLGGRDFARDADNNKFTLEVGGSIGPTQNGVFDLGAPDLQYRNLYLTGQTTSGGNITISNAAPAITFIETDNANYQYSINTNNGQFLIRDNTGGTDDLLLNSNGDINLAGGSASTGCTITNSNGTLTCSGDITTTATTGIQGWFQRNSGALSPTNITDDFLLGATSTASARFGVVNIAAGTPTASLSAGLSGGTYVTANGTLATTNSQTLTLGSASTGNIVLTPGGASTITFSGYGQGIIHSSATGILSSSLIDLTADVTGILPITNGGSPFDQGNGAIFERIPSQDFLLGANSTASAKFAFTGVNSGTPTASISANTANNATYLTGDGTLGTTNAQTLTLGSTSTGNINFFSSANVLTSAGNLTLAGSGTFGGNLIVNGTTATVGNGSAFSIQTTGNGALNLLSSGSGNIVLGQNAGNGTVIVQPNAGGQAGLIVNDQGLGDLLTASASGTSKFSISHTGVITANNYSTGIAHFNAQGVISSSLVDLTSDVTGILPITNGGSPFTSVSGAIVERIPSEDLLLGSNATSSAKFAFTGVNSGVPTASISAGTDNALSLNANGLIQTQNAETLTLGGANTGNVVLSSAGITALTASGANLIANGTITGLTGITSSGTITFSGLNTAGVVHTDINGQLSTSLVNLTTDVSGILPVTNGGSPFTQGNGAIIERIPSQDLLLGANATASAKFAFTNVNTGIPTASISAGIGGGATYITGNGTLATVNAQSLTLGSSTTGNVGIFGFSTGIVHSNTSGVLSSSAVDLASADVTGVLGPTKGGTGLNAYTKGDLIYASAVNTVGSPGTELEFAL